MSNFFFIKYLLYFHERMIEKIINKKYYEIFDEISKVYLIKISGR